MIPRGSNAKKTEFKHAYYQRILDTQMHKRGESFTASDIYHHFDNDVALSLIASYLREMVDGGMLSVRGISNAHGTTQHYSKKPSPLLRRKWRNNSNGQLSVIPLPLLGSY